MKLNPLLLRLCAVIAVVALVLFATGPAKAANYTTDSSCVEVGKADYDQWVQLTNNYAASKYPNFIGKLSALPDNIREQLLDYHIQKCVEDANLSIGEAVDEVVEETEPAINKYLGLKQSS